MAASDTTKPATALIGEPASKTEQLVSKLNSENTPPPAELQVRRLARQFGFAFETAVVVASLAWGIAR